MHIRHARFAILALLFAFTLMAVAKDAPSDKAEPFSDAVAERLMSQARNGLIAGNANTMLAAFDRDNMSGYGDFASQLRAFFTTWENVRVHYQILRTAATSCATACGTATVQFEMEADNVQSELPGIRRGAQLELTFQRTDKGWRILNLTPRDIFQ